MAEAESLTLKQLRYLLALDEVNHFRRAAEICGISQPSLTTQIQAIEEVLGVHLVERSRSGVSFTPTGREVAVRARRIMDEVQNLVDFTAGAQRGLVGTIRLGSKATLGPYLLPHVVARLHKEYPDLNLYVRESTPRELEYELTRGIHDLILAQLPVTGAELVTERLFREPLYLALAADHPLADHDALDPSDLKGMEVLSLNPQFHLHQQIIDLCKDFGAVPVRDYEGTSLDALRLMVGMGMGAAFLPALYARSEIPNRGEVVVKRIKGKVINRSVGLVWRKSAGKAETYRMIAQVIRDVIGKKFDDIIVEG
ncbi:MAG: hydrogen peroxide-inducible genes activator [Aquisalinus sp.]|nr:hydrogen peroxide-inducible genes activator [Aquisalinus sp.]